MQVTGEGESIVAEQGTALIFGGSGAIGSTTGAVLARKGFRVVLAARSVTGLERTARRIQEAGGDVDIVPIDVLDEGLTARRMGEISRSHSHLDVVVNATSFMHDQGKSIDDLSLGEFEQGVTPFLRGLFNISKGVAQHMGNGRPGVFLTVVAPAARLAMPGHLGHIAGCAGTEAFCKGLASELGPRNIRVLCLRSHAIADAIEAGSYTGELFRNKAQSLGLDVHQWMLGAADSAMLGRLPTLLQIAETIAFLSSEHAAAMTATTVNLTSGLTTE